MLELGMSFSLEQLVIDNDIIGMIRYAKRGIGVSRQTIAYDSIREVGIGNNFLGYPDTLKNVGLPSHPAVFDRRMYDPWKKDGAKSTADLAHEIVDSILSSPVSNPLSADAAEAIDAIISRKEKEIAAML